MESEKERYMDRFCIRYFWKACLMSAVILGVTILLCALLMLKTELREEIIGIILIIADVIAVFCGGFYVGRKVGQKKFLWGLGYGICFFGVYVLLAIIFGHGETQTAQVIKKLFLMGISGMAGGMLS